MVKKRASYRIRKTLDNSEIREEPRDKMMRRSKRRRSGETENDGTVDNWEIANLNNNFEETLRRSRSQRKERRSEVKECDGTGYGNMDNLSLNKSSKRVESRSGKGGSLKQGRDVSDSGGGDIASMKKKKLPRHAALELEWKKMAVELEAAKKATAEVRKMAEAGIEKDATEALKKKILILKRETEEMYELERKENEEFAAERKALKIEMVEVMNMSMAGPKSGGDAVVVAMLKKELEAQAEVRKYQEMQKSELAFLKNVVNVLVADNDPAET